MQEFHCKAYKATERKELISLLNEFLDSSIVLPPCDWEREELLSLRELKEKSEQIKQRKTRAAAQKGIFIYELLILHIYLIHFYDGF